MPRKRELSALGLDVGIEGRSNPAERAVVRTNDEPSGRARRPPEERMDRTLVERAGRGDHDAFSALVLATGDHLFRVARLILRDRERAEDAVQDAFERVWRQLPRLRDVERFDAWSMRILVNACR